MIRLFSHTETDFTHNGIHVLDDIALGDTCILSNGINEVYSLEMEVSIYNNSKWKDIESEMILKVPTPKGEQLFRIKEVVKGFSTIKIYGKHIFFDLENNFILDTNIVKKDGRSAIAQILGAMTNNMVNSFHGTSDISNFNNSRLVRKNVVTALIGDDNNSFLNRWGGELELNNFNFSINERIGSDRGFQIRYGKNATGYEGNINTYNLCTRIVPVGFDGLMLEGTKWVDSPNIAKYPQIYTYEVKFEDIKVKENEDDEEGYNTIEEAREALREAAVNYFTSTECDLPSFSAIVNFITLRNTEEFKNVKALETVALGDDVSIYLSNIDVNASSRVVREKWNFFTKKHVELEIGEIKPNVFKQLINIKDTIDNIVESLGGNTWQDIINKSLDEATKLMEEGLKGSHVITMKNQIVIGDAPDIKDMVNCIVFNKNGIGFSNNGYLPDRLVSAMTIDGKINASCITTGELNAALIKTGVLMSANGKTWINMEDGTFNFSDNLLFDGKTTIYRGALKVEGENGKFAMLEPFGKDGEIQFRMTLAGEGIGSNFNIIDGTGKELFRVGHGGVELDNNITFRTDQTGDYNGDCYWEHGTYYPANDWKNIIGKNSNAFYKVFSYKFGLDRTGSERYADFEGPIFRLISSWGYGGLAGDMEGHFFPEQNNAWSFGKSDKRISTVYCTNINQPSDLKLKENVKYLLRDEVQTLSLEQEGNNSDITTQDCYDFIKNDLKLAQFNYKLLEEKENEKIETIGFIAQDIEDTKIGDILLSKDENNILSYDNATYIGILASALQKAIDKIETLEKIINKLQY